jgi:hypothetical protein
LKSAETQALLDGMGDCLSSAERRRRRRVRLHWPLSILKGQPRARILATVTEDLSSCGFCCVVDEPLAVGESVPCVLGFAPKQDPQGSQGLRCQAQVVWVRVTEDGRFGMGCRIDEYSVVA